MGNLGARLARMRRGRPVSTTPDALPPTNVAQASRSVAERARRAGLHNRIGAAPGDVADLADSIGGTVTANGLIHRSELVEIDQLCQRDLRELCEFLGFGDRVRSPVFLDTETTGLAGGTGTLVFLAGVATFEGEGVQVRQWLMSQFRAEADLLGHLRSICADADLLVTYNGKSFDAPLLSTRYRLQAMDDPLDGLAHFDALHMVRRFWGRIWPDCRLATAEERLLGLSRHGDLPGSEAPESWFAWLRAGEIDRLSRAVNHNGQDLVSLAGLVGAAARAVKNPRPGRIDVAALAREHESKRGPAAARQLLCAHEDSLDQDDLLYLGQLFKRERCWQDAVRLWERLAGTGVSDAMLELAKFHEHRSRDLHTALHWTRALVGADGHLEAHRNRETRLRRKLAGSEGWGADRCVRIGHHSL